MLLLNQATKFPEPLHYPTSLEEPLCIGGALTPDTVLNAYRLGIFPWYNADSAIAWWCPDPRFVLYPEQLKVSRSMKKLLRDGVFRITENEAFSEVIKHCSTQPRHGQQGSWIHDEVIDVYTTLHQQGYAHSVEAWQNDTLVGGLYGLKINHVFSGESMFAAVSNASKAAFITFVQKHRTALTLIDCQTPTPHLQSLGGTAISKQAFMQILRGDANNPPN